ncbi:hypothetical protein ACGFNU_47960 [Spirillospora sp. NPDC048911]|uniref:hypothetical protein n=1 Tax=Spirillospora sp. NPDC048911 TaxID=3364527 RepID=UPI003713C582
MARWRLHPNDLLAASGPSAGFGLVGADVVDDHPGREGVWASGAPGFFTTILPSGAGGTNVGDSPDAAVNCRSAGEGSAFLPSLSGVRALDLRSPTLSGIVPNVVDKRRAAAVAALQTAGFVVQVGRGSVDCGPPYVQAQWPVGGTTAVLGSTVAIDVSRQPNPGDCP